MDNKEMTNWDLDNLDNYEILGDDYPFYDLSFKVIVIGNSGRF